MMIVTVNASYIGVVEDHKHQLPFVVKPKESPTSAPIPRLST